MKMRDKLCSIVLSGAVAVILAPAASRATAAGGQKTQIPERPFGEKPPTRDWGIVHRDTDGEQWYRRHLAKDLRTMRENVERLEEAVRAGDERARDAARAAERIAASARSARNNLRRGDDGAEREPAAKTDAEPGTVAERVQKIARLQSEVWRRMAEESRAQQVDLQGREETLSLLVEIEQLALAVRESARGTER